LSRHRDRMEKFHGLINRSMGLWLSVSP
jgi:hypothetical protein